MRHTTPVPTRRTARHVAARVTARVTAAAALGLLTAAGPLAASASAASPLTPDTPQLVSMVDSPAVQLVVDHQQANITWYEPALNSDALIAFANDNATINQAANSGDLAGASAAIVNEFLANPGSYLTKGTSSSVTASMSSTGSAWGVSSNGYLVTNHHVVQQIPAATWIADALTGSSSQSSVVADVAQTLVTDLTSGLDVGGKPLEVSDAEPQQLEELAVEWVEQESGVDVTSQTVDVGGGQNVDVTDSGLQAQIVSTSAGTWPAKDVAILKIDTTNLPVIPLGDDATLEVGDTVEALGYPYDASFASGTSTTAMVTATQTSGQVTNRLSTHGYSAIEDTATINHGSSGGPLLDSSGRVVGMVTAVDSSTDTDQSVNGGKFFYAVPVSVIKSYLTAAGVLPLVSPDQLIYERAMFEMQQSHYRAALADLKQVQTDGFSTPYIGLHTTMVEQAIAHGEDRPLSTHRPLWQLIPAGALALAGIGALVLLTVRRRPGRAGVVDPAAAGGPQPIAPVGVVAPTASADRTRDDALV